MVFIRLSRLQNLQAEVQQRHRLPVVKGEILQVIAADNTSIPLVMAGRALRKVLGVSSPTCSYQQPLSLPGDYNLAA